MVSAQATAVIQKGVCGEKRSQSCAPIQGMGSERMPREVPKKPKASPRFSSGMTFEMRES